MKLMALIETEVFVNQNNGVTIKQSCWPDEDQMIILNGGQVELVMLELQKILKQNQFSLIVQEGEEE